MESKEVIEEILQVIDDTENAGHNTLSIPAMKNYLKNFAIDLGDDNHRITLIQERELALFKAENDRNIAASVNQTAHSVEMFKSVITAGQSALKASMIINGGAAVALLAFTGKIWNSTVSTKVANDLQSAILIFCFGVLSSAIASGFTYITQCLYAYNKESVGRIFNILTMLCVLLSYLLFAYAAVQSSFSFGVHLNL